MNTELRNGPIPFARFMELALYHPQGGYYSQPRPRVGQGGDFKTSPHQSPWFGRMVAQQIDAIWKAMDRPQSFSIMEFGPGEGWLAYDILTAIEADGAPGLASAARYILIEHSLPAQERIKERLARWIGSEPKGPTVCLGEWPPGESDEPISGLVLAHEFLDAFPVHILVETENGLTERYIEMQDSKLAFMDGPLSEVYLSEWLPDLGVTLERGQVAEVCPSATEWMETISRRIERGGVLIFDYGFSSQALYHPSRREGTLRGYQAHQMISNPLERPGETDLTAHVDFSAILRSAKAGGLSLAGFTDQSHYLLDLGIAEALQNETGDDTVMASERRAAMGLLDPAGLGSAIKVMLLTKALEGTSLPGFSMKPDDRESLATLRP